MSNYIVDGSDLTDIADAIRAKGGTSAQLAFPQGFVDAVEAIETGGGSLPANWKMISGTVTVASSTTTLKIPLGNSGITKILYALAVCEDYAHWTKYREYSQVIIRYYFDYMRNTLASASNLLGITEINANKNLENWGNATASISGGFINMNPPSGKTSATAKPEVQFIFVVIGE
jgi:hypothetical protein